MLSIIICSRKSDISFELKQNIADTIGCEYELIVIDNSRNQYDIFQAYNLGIEKAGGEILCFMHDDILMHTNNWGDVLQEQFKDNSIGMIGVGGSHFISSIPMYWSSSPFIAQYNWHNDNGIIEKNITIDTFNGELADVAVVDGVFFCIPKKLFKTLRFDSNCYTGFHVYDMDISMQVLALGKRVCVTKGFIVEHFWSERRLQNQKYLDILEKNLAIFSEKWKPFLPVVKGINEPEHVIRRLDNLFAAAYEAKKVRRSKAYKLGRVLLAPFRFIKNLF